MNLDTAHVKKKTLSKLFLDEMLKKIELGELKPGDRLPSERELSTAFDISRPGIREAMHILQSMGYVESKIGGGTFVTCAKIENILPQFARLLTQNVPFTSDFFEIRELLECHCARYTAENNGRESARRLRAILETADQKDSDFLECYNEFHLELVANTGNTAIELFGQLCIKLTSPPMSSAIATKEDIRSVILEHEKICDAIASGDGSAAETAIRQHLKCTLSRLDKR